MNSENDPMNADSSNLDNKVMSWLESEGYPLEFAVANIFRKHGLVAKQGQYVRSADANLAREVDVIASSTSQRAGTQPMLRFSFLAECKWSKDKPWVVLTSPHTRMTAAACTSQMITSKLTEAALWAIAGDAELHNKTTLSQSNEENGFNGRQALSKNQDAFYSSLQSIVDKCYCYVNEYRDASLAGTMPTNGIIAFPLIVIEGILFQGSYNETAQKVELQRKDWIRCFWNGSTSWPYLATVDVITLDGLDVYLSTRGPEITYLLQRLVKTSEEIAACCAAKSLESLTTSTGARGVIGLPTLLYEIDEAGKSSATSRGTKKQFSVVGPDASRFRAEAEPIGIPADTFAESEPIFLSRNPVTWLRLMPVFDQQKDWLENDLKNAILTGGAKFISGFHPSMFRASDGFGLYARTNDDPHVTPAAVFAAKTGEIWSTDTYLVEAYARERNLIPHLEPGMAEALDGMYVFLEKIGVIGPYRWIAGIEGIMGKKLFDSGGRLGGFRGSIGTSVAERVISRGTYDPKTGGQASLEAFFTQLWDVCGAKRVRSE